MTEIINLNKFRKSKIKQKDKIKAQENRVIYGVSTKARKALADEEARKATLLAEKRLTPDDTNKRS